MFNKKELSEIRHQLKVFTTAKANGNISLTCRYFGISRDTYYRWLRQYRKYGEKGLANSKPCSAATRSAEPAGQMISNTDSQSQIIPGLTDRLSE